MKTVSEIRIEAIRVINNIITLKSNVTNGCYSDKAALEVAEARLSGIKSWAIANDQMPEIRNYFASHNFGQNNQFAASEVASFFNN